jgi:ADP-ribose pyrophosphatase YjhB (NUDIX family)
VRKFTYIAKKLIREVHGTKGMQLLQKDGSNAQSTVDQHLHFHCIPFDAPDLSVWNYRKLQYTPLENVELYRQARKKIIKTNAKFETEYKQPSGLPIICDAVIINEKQEVLLQKRADGHTMLPPHDTLPGGRVDNFNVSLENELVREIREETGMTVKPTQLKLVVSRITTLTYLQTSPHLGVKYGEEMQCLCNTYAVTGIKSTTTLTPDDDAKELYWLPISRVADSPDLVPELKEAILKAAA